MDRKLGGLLVVFFLLFTVFATVIFLSSSGQLVTFTRASADNKPSETNSLLFGYPLMVKADGQTKSTINIFLRSANGTPVKDQKVTVTSSHGSLSESEVTTNEQGKATITLTATTPGTAAIEAFIGGTTKLTQALSIQFN